MTRGACAPPSTRSSCRHRRRPPPRPRGDAYRPTTRGRWSASRRRQQGAARRRPSRPATAAPGAAARRRRDGGRAPRARGPAGRRRAVIELYAARVDELATCRARRATVTCPGLTAETRRAPTPVGRRRLVLGGGQLRRRRRATALHLAEAHSSAVDTSYQGASGDELAVRGWAGGAAVRGAVPRQRGAAPSTAPSRGPSVDGRSACGRRLRRAHATSPSPFLTVCVRGRAVNALAPALVGRRRGGAARAGRRREPLEVLSGSEIRSSGRRRPPPPAPSWGTRCTGTRPTRSTPPRAARRTARPSSQLPDPGAPRGRRPDRWSRASW